MGNPCSINPPPLSLSVALKSGGLLLIMHVSSLCTALHGIVVRHSVTSTSEGLAPFADLWHRCSR
jgi:hypothetical protein